jgi:hypothetical protein
MSYFFGLLADAAATVTAGCAGVLSVAFFFFISFFGFLSPIGTTSFSPIRKRIYFGVVVEGTEDAGTATFFGAFFFLTSRFLMVFSPMANPSIHFL